MCTKVLDATCEQDPKQLEAIGDVTSTKGETLTMDFFYTPTIDRQIRSCSVKGSSSDYLLKCADMGHCLSDANQAPSRFYI